MKKFKIPVTREMSGFVEVEAKSLEDAVERFDNGYGDMCGLPKNSEYIEESFRRSCDDLPVQDVLNIYEDYQ